MYSAGEAAEAVALHDCFAQLIRALDLVLTLGILVRPTDSESGRDPILDQ